MEFGKATIDRITECAEPTERIIEVIEDRVDPILLGEQDLTRHGGGHSMLRLVALLAWMIRIDEVPSLRSDDILRERLHIRDRFDTHGLSAKHARHLDGNEAHAAIGHLREKCF